MTSPVQGNNALYHYSPQHPSQSQRGHESYKETVARQAEASISLITDEGDVVNISSSHQYTSSLYAESWNTPVKEGMNFTAAAMTVNSFELSVEGDLSEEELADIESLLGDLSSIAGNFFSGNLSDAMDEAMNIGDMGTVSQLSASFSYSAAWSATQLTQHHPLPASDNLASSLEGPFTDISEIIDQAHTDEMGYAEMLQAQWQQIKEFLEAREEKTVEQTSGPLADNDMPIARRMMNRIQETVAKHPRLAPFSVPLAHEAIDSEMESVQHPALYSQKHQLKNSFMNEFNNWMYS